MGAWPGPGTWAPSRDRTRIRGPAQPGLCWGISRWALCLGSGARLLLRLITVVVVAGESWASALQGAPKLLVCTLACSQPEPCPGATRAQRRPGQGPGPELVVCLVAGAQGRGLSWWWWSPAARKPGLKPPLPGLALLLSWGLSTISCAGLGFLRPGLGIQVAQWGLLRL